MTSKTQLQLHNMIFITTKVLPLCSIQIQIVSILDCHLISKFNAIVISGHIKVKLAYIISGHLIVSLVLLPPQGLLIV
jgi:hypothetical protein